MDVHGPGRRSPDPMPSVLAISVGPNPCAFISRTLIASDRGGAAFVDAIRLRAVTL
jgi:hypothetical protein